MNGLLAGFTGEGAKTVIPADGDGEGQHAPGARPGPGKIGELFEAYMKKVAPKTVELTLTRMHGGKPWMTDFDNPFVQAAGRAIEQGFGKPPVFCREGGSIPVVSTFQQELGVPIGALRRRAARRERARAEREAGPRQLPQRHHRVSVPVRGGGPTAVVGPSFSLGNAAPVVPELKLGPTYCHFVMPLAD